MKAFYDVETFKNFFCVTFEDVENGEVSQFEISFRKNQVKELREYLSVYKYLIGFNNIDFDAPVLDYATNNPSAKLIYDFAQAIISDKKKGKERIPMSENLKAWIKKDRDWFDHDLFRMLNFNNTGVGLKYTSVALLHSKVQDLPLHYTDEVTLDNADMVLNYNINDVAITKKLYFKVKEKWQLRESLSAKWEIDFMSSSDSKMGTELLEVIYAQMSGVDLNVLRKLRTFRDSVKLSDIILEKIEFKTEYLKSFLSKLKNKTLYAINSFKHEEKIDFGNIRYTVGSGGIHSLDKEKPGVFEADENFMLCDYDKSSYYPNLIIRYGFKPAHLNDDFITLLEKITNDRIKAKKEQGSKSPEAESLKIVINSMFGKLGSDSHWVYDPKSMLSVTINGQLFLLMIIEELWLSGIETISANTDGILCKIPIDKKEEFEKITKKYMEFMQIEGEYTYYKKYIRRDVNTYITIKLNGEYKYKGALTPKAELGKGYKHPIVPKAVFDFYVHGKSVEETIKECKDIHQFCIAQKIGGQFTPELHEEVETENEEENTIEIVKLQKTTRFYVSNSGGEFVKRKEDGSLSRLVVGYNVTVLNDIDENKPFEEYDINYDYYIRECYKFINSITPKFSRYEMKQKTNSKQVINNILDESALTRKPEVNPYKILLDEKYTGEKFWKKLLQIIKKNIVFAKGYYLVKDIKQGSKESKTNRVTVLALSTLKKPTVRCYKKDFSKKPFDENSILFCDKWQKKGKYSFNEITQKVEQSTTEFEYYMEEYHVATEKELKYIIEKELK